MYAKLVGEGKANIPEHLSIAILCKEMGWDYWTYLAQPAWFVSALRMMKRVEYDEQKLREKLNG